MAISVKIQVRKNTLSNENIALAQVINLQQMDFAALCDYLAQDSTVGAADVAAVMTQLEKKLPLLLSLGTKVQLSAEGMTARPTVSGSLTQSALRAKLQAKKDAGDTSVNVDRPLKTSDLTVSDLTAGVSLDFSKKFLTAFAQNATFKRTTSTEAATEDDTQVDIKPNTSDSSSSSSSTPTGGGSTGEDTDGEGE